MTSGYYRFPTIQGDTLVFVCEDDLWTVSTAGGLARRLTSSLGEATRPALSPDGSWLAFVGREEGRNEIYLMPSVGGAAQRLTYLGGSVCQTVGWAGTGAVLLANSAGHWDSRVPYLYRVDLDGSAPERLNYGPAQAISFGPGGGVVLGRNLGDPARWKRYRGGTAGQLWIDADGAGEFHPLIQLPGDLASPMWLWQPGSPGRIFFLSDHEGIGNLYSCLSTGVDLRRHTDHEDFYARNASTDGRRIVYHAGADLYIYDPAVEENLLVPIEFHSPQTQRNRKFVNPARFLQDFSLHPGGHSVAITTRGQLFSFSNWEGAVQPYGEEQEASGNHPPSAAPTPTAVRYRLPQWLNDGERLIAVSDADGEESFVVFPAGSDGEVMHFTGLDTGRPSNLAVNPCKDQIVFSNHRYELMFLDLETRQLLIIDRGKAAPMAGFAWSPDGEWVAYSVSTSLQTAALKLWRRATGEVFPLTQPVLRDIAPAFDPEGKYLYFLSYRSFEPVYDNLQFDLGFPRGVKPYLLTLRADLPSPFIARSGAQAEAQKSPPQETGAGERPAREGQAEETASPPQEADAAGGEALPITIDLDGIERRVVAFPVADGIYGRIQGILEGRVLYSCFPVESTLSLSLGDDSDSRASLMIYNFEDQKEETLLSDISDFDVSRDRKSSIIRYENRLRVLKAGEKPNGNGDAPHRKNGWLDLRRVKVSVLPGAEWRQMFREAWRLQRDHFWTSDMSQVDWLVIHDRYLPLVERLSSRSEFSDLMWEMQGELGTSHAYELGGDYRPGPNISQGFLGADFSFDASAGGWRIVHIYSGDSWNPKADSPLNGPGLNVRPGDLLLAIDGRRLTHRLSPAAALVNRAGDEVALTLRSESEPSARTLTVKTLSSEVAVRYREWIEINRRKVHQETGGRVGYVHIPDMGPGGFAEFHRGFLAEVDREGLIVDVRFNRGGHVSALLLEKLARRRIGYDASRWGQIPIPYPPESVLGPMVAITNEFAGSDGDIFSHGFKVLKLGPLIGKRTWGGVVGIEPNRTLVDGTLTTQPEFSSWFFDIGWNIENYGADPDVEVDITPQDFAQGRDPQLDRAIAEILALLAAEPPKLPDFTQKPSRSIPRLPPR